MAISLKKIPKGTQFTPEAITYAANRAKELAQAYSNRLASLNRHVEEAQARITEEARQIVREAAPEHRATAREYAARRASRKMNEFRRNIVASSANARRELIDQLTELRERADFLVSINPNPLSWLQRVGLGTERRTHLQTQLADAGPTELAAFAAQAIVQNDLVMAASVATVIARTPRDKRQADFSAHELSEIVAGDQHRALLGQLTEVVNAHAAAEAADRTFSTGKANDTIKIETALRQRDIDALNPGEDADAA